MILASITPQSNNQRVANWLARRAIAGEYTRSATPYPNSGRSVRHNPLPDGGSAAFFYSDDYAPEMADCRGY